MKRNRFGINIDEGVPLSSDSEFELLYVPCFGETADHLLWWLQENDKPLRLGGQIGSGKSTLINKAIRETDQIPDITFHFDQETLNLDAGDFWSIALAGIIKTALEQEIDLKFCNLPEELGQYPAYDWQALLEGLEYQTFSMTSFNNKIRLRKNVAENAEYVGTIVSEIGRLLQEKLNRPLFILALGLDKFDPLSSAYFSMQDMVAALAKFKTLYEVNAAHLFHKFGSPLYPINRLFITTLKMEATEEMLAKRMGIYAQPLKHELKTIARWSGGNPRQALRLLSHFDSARKKRRIPTESLLVAIQETAGDFFAYSDKPSVELMNTIRRSSSISSTMFSLPGDKETALRALYGNWILINGKSIGDSWPVIINPLVKTAFAIKTTPEDPELKLLREYAAISGVSSTGLGPQRFYEQSTQEKNADKLLWEITASGLEHPIHTNLSETLDIIGDALLSMDRPDRVILAYKNQNIQAAARAYLFAKANSYEYQRCKHTTIIGGPGKNPMAELEAFLSEDTDIFSIDFEGRWESTQLEALDKQRDRLISCQMLWWIPHSDLKKYLPKWTQLRQLFELFILEDELLGSISEEEVKADLAFFEELVDNKQSSEEATVSNLRIVLEYLQSVKQGENHE